MKSYNVEIIEQRKINLDIIAKNQPEAVKQAYSHKALLDNCQDKEFVKIRARQVIKHD